MKTIFPFTTNFAFNNQIKLRYIRNGEGPFWCGPNRPCTLILESLKYNSYQKLPKAFKTLIDNEYENYQVGNLKKIERQGQSQRKNHGQNENGNDWERCSSSTQCADGITCDVPADCYACCKGDTSLGLNQTCVHMSQPDSNGCSAHEGSDWSYHDGFVCD